MMLKIFGLVTLSILMVVHGGLNVEYASAISREWISTIGEFMGGPPSEPTSVNITEQQQKLKEQDWQTYYSSKYRFSIDYPNYNGKTNITEDIDPDGIITISLYTPTILYSVIIQDNSVKRLDPQELAVRSSLNLKEGEDMMAGGVKPLILDDKLGYIFATMNPSIKERMYFESSGLLYVHNDVA